MPGSAPPLFLLLLLALLLTVKAPGAVAEADSAPVHGVSVSVRSTRSVLYHGMQVPLFENVGGGTESGRYFFPPLALLDCDSTRMIDPDDAAAAAADDSGGASSDDATASSPRRRRSVFQLTVLLWTDEFLSSARAQLASEAASAHVELMPLTELTLNWSGQAGRWLGPGYERRLRLLGGWRDAQKPRARATFAVECDLPADCRQLMSHLGETDGSAGHLFDLKYRIRCDSQRRLSVPLASRHLLRSPLFLRLRMFAAKSLGIVLASETTVDQLATELCRAALDELQDRQLGEQRADSIDPAALTALSADAGRLLRRAPVRGAGLTQWAERVFWQPPPDSKLSGGGGLRPDRLAGLFNRLLTPEVGGRPRLVRPAPNATDLLADLAGEGDLPPGALAAFHRFLASRGGPAAEPTDVDDVRELAASVGSAVAWDAASVRFAPSPNVQLYELDTGRLLSVGTFAVRDAVLRYRVSEQRDHVTPMCRAVHGSADYTETSWPAQAELLRRRLRPLIRRAANASVELGRLEVALAAAIAEAGPNAQVRHRSRDSESPLDTAEAASLRSSIEALTSRVRALSDSASESAADAAAVWQGRFADSFCVLANSGPPPTGMTCRTISFVLPKASLRGGFLDRTVRLGIGTAGQNLMQPMGKKFYRFQLRGCCK